jgi:hypothetical protein
MKVKMGEGFLKRLAGKIPPVLLALGLAALLAVPALAQGNFGFTVRKQLGFNNGSQIRGVFSIQTYNNPPDLVSVTYLLDGQPLGTATAAPFKITFDTRSYAEGWHELSAIGRTGAGDAVNAPAQRFQFVSAAEQNRFMMMIIVPIFGGIALVFLLVVGIQVLVSRRSKGAALPLGAPRTYGLKGGAICPRCKRPFGLHVWSLNLVTGCLDRCDHCGRVGFFRRASRQALAAAEQAELAMAQPAAPIHEPSEEEKLREQIEQSKYLDM